MIAVVGPDKISKVGTSAERKQTKFWANVPTLEILFGPNTAIIDQIRMFSGLFFRVDFKCCLKFMIPAL